MPNFNDHLTSADRRLFWWISLIFLAPHFPWLSASSKDLERCRLASDLFWHDKRGKKDSDISQWRSWLSQMDCHTPETQSWTNTFLFKSCGVFWSKHVFICVFLHGIYCMSVWWVHTVQMCLIQQLWRNQSLMWNTAHGSHICPASSVGSQRLADAARQRGRVSSERQR